MKFIYKMVSKLRAYLAAKIIFEQVFDEKDDEEGIVRISESCENSGGEKDVNLVNSEKPQKSPTATPSINNNNVCGTAADYPELNKRVTATGFGLRLVIRISRFQLKFS